MSDPERGATGTITSMLPRLKPLAAFVTLALIWGTTWGVIKIGLRSLPPLVFASARMAVAGVLMVGLMKVLGIRWPRTARLYLALVVVGILMAASFGFVFWGEQYVASGLTAVLTSTAPLWTAAVAHVALRAEPMTLSKTGALVIGVGGTALLFGGRVSVAGPRGVLAVALLSIVPLTWALASVMVKRELAQMPTVGVAGLEMLFGSVVLLAFAGIVDAGKPVIWDARGLLALAYMTIVGSCLAFFLFFWLVQHVRVTTSSLFSLVTPAEAVLFGVLFLNERLTPRQALGFLVIMAGLALYLVSARREEAAAVVQAA